MNKEKTKLNFGEKVKVSHKLVRVKERVLPVEYGYSQYHFFWDKREIKETEVLVIGRKKVSNGTVSFMGRYRPFHFFDVYVVVEDIDKKPFYIFL